MFHASGLAKHMVKASPKIFGANLQSMIREHNSSGLNGTPELIDVVRTSSQEGPPHPGIAALSLTPQIMRLVCELDEVDGEEGAEMMRNRDKNAEKWSVPCRAKGTAYQVGRGKLVFFASLVTK